MREKWKVKCTLIGLPLDNFKNEKRCEYQRRYRLTRSGFFLGGWQVKSATSFWNLRVSTRSFVSQNVKWPDIFPKYLVLGSVPGQTASMFSQNYLADLLSAWSLLAKLPRKSSSVWTATYFSEICDVELASPSRRIFSVLSANYPSYFCETNLADSLHFALRVIFLKSASLISQSHLADVPQFELRLLTASSFSHILISQLADLLQKGLRLNFQILRECSRSILSQMFFSLQITPILHKHFHLDGSQPKHESIIKIYVRRNKLMKLFNPQTYALNAIENFHRLSILAKNIKLKD